MTISFQYKYIYIYIYIYIYFIIIQIHAKIGSIKDRNDADLTEAEDIRKRWQEYTEELYKKDLHYPDNHNGVITHLEADTMECEVKWALGSIPRNKDSRGDGIPVELFQILKDDAVKVLHSILWLFGSQQTLENSESDGIPDHLTCLLRNLYAGQEATVRTGHGKQTGSK